MTASISTAATLSPLVNGYKVSVGPPKTIIVPKASQLAALQEVTITGTLDARRKTIHVDSITVAR